MKMRRQRVAPRKLKVIASAAASNSASTGDMRSQRRPTMKTDHEAAQTRSAGSGQGIRCHGGFDRPVLSIVEGLSPNGSGLTGSEMKREPDAAPVPPVDGDRCGGFLHHDELAAAHVAAVGLEQERPRVACRREPRAVV